MSPLFAIVLSACTDPRSGTGKHGHSGDTGVPSDSGASGDTADDADTGEEGQPYYDCGEAPTSAIALEVTSYYDVAQYFNNARASGNVWGWYLDGSGANSRSETCDPDEVRADYHAGADGAYSVHVAITMPQDYPPNYLGEYRNPDGALGARPGASISIYYLNDSHDATLISGSSADQDGDQSILCLSRVRADRVSGTFTYIADDSSRLPDDFFLTFDLISETDLADNDGTCMLPAFYDFYEDPDAVWDPVYWERFEDAGTDTGEP